MTDKVVIITGGTSGLGYQTALASIHNYPDSKIIITGRGKDSSQRAADKINRITGTSNCEGVALDLSSFQSIIDFADLFGGRNKRDITTLICNAGVQKVNGLSFTQDGLEMTFGVNHIGHFLLAHLLLPSLLPAGQIIFVASDTHDPTRKTGMPAPRLSDISSLAYPTVEDKTEDAGELGRIRYTTSKLCNVMCALEFPKRLQGQYADIRVNAFNPGLMLDTDLVRDYSKLQLMKLTLQNLKYFPPQILRRNSSVKMGQALAKLALSQKSKSVTGKYFDGFNEATPSAEARNELLAARLWDESIKICQLNNQYDRRCG